MEGECKICGCTNFYCRQCIEKTGMPCVWVDDDKDLCSACEAKDTALTMLQLLANATGAKFENENLAVDIMEKTLIKYRKNE